MKGSEHYRQAEQLSAQAHAVEPDYAAYLVAKAQVHATLALAAATTGTWFGDPAERPEPMRLDSPEYECCASGSCEVCRR